jgi:hypothetical protein
MAVFAQLLRPSTAAACDAQRENDVYLDAKAQVSRMTAQERSRIASEWSSLESEQKSLWELAGRIDEQCRRGELSDEIFAYNLRVAEWQDRLHQFLRRLHSPVDAPGAAENLAGGSGPAAQPQLQAPPADIPAEIEFGKRAARPSPAPARPSPAPAPPAPKTQPSQTPETTTVRPSLL